MPFFITKLSIVIRKKEKNEESNYRFFRESSRP